MKTLVALLILCALSIHYVANPFEVPAVPDKYISSNIIGLDKKRVFELLGPPDYTNESQSMVEFYYSKWYSPATFQVFFNSSGRVEFYSNDLD